MRVPCSFKSQDPSLAQLHSKTVDVGKVAPLVILLSYCCLLMKLTANINMITILPTSTNQTTSNKGKILSQNFLLLA